MGISGPADLQVPPGDVRPVRGIDVPAAEYRGHALDLD